MLRRIFSVEVMGQTEVATINPFYLVQFYISYRNELFALQEQHKLHFLYHAQHWAEIS